MVCIGQHREFAEASIFRSGYRSVQLEASRNALNFYMRRGYIQHGLPDAEGAYPLRKELSSIENETIIFVRILHCKDIYRKFP